MAAPVRYLSGIFRGELKWEETGLIRAMYRPCARVDIWRGLSDTAMHVGSFKVLSVIPGRAIPGVIFDVSKTSITSWEDVWRNASAELACEGDRYDWRMVRLAYYAISACWTTAEGTASAVMFINRVVPSLWLIWKRQLTVESTRLANPMYVKAPNAQSPVRFITRDIHCFSRQKTWYWA